MLCARRLLNLPPPPPPLAPAGGQPAAPKPPPPPKIKRPRGWNTWTPSEKWQDDPVVDAGAPAAGLPVLLPVLPCTACVSCLLCATLLWLAQQSLLSGMHACMQRPRGEQMFGMRACHLSPSPWLAADPGGCLVMGDLAELLLAMPEAEDCDDT